MNQQKTIANFSIDLTGRTAIVTGASAGLGRRFGLVLAACGAKVACTARRKDKLDELVAEIAASGALRRLSLWMFVMPSNYRKSFPPWPNRLVNLTY